MDLHLSPEEQQLLAQILDQHYHQLLWELARTDRSPMKTELREQVRILEGLLEKAQTREPAA